MSLYEVMLFLHVAGALGFGAGAFMSLFTLWTLRRAQRIEQLHFYFKLFSMTGPVLGISMLVNVAAGLYMTADTWGWDTRWIMVAIVGVVLYIAAGAVMGTRRAAIANRINDLPDGPLPQDVEQRIHDPLFGTSIVVMQALLLGIVYLMTVKPALTGSIITLVVAVILGVLASLPTWRSEAAGTSAGQHR